MAACVLSAEGGKSGAAPWGGGVINPPRGADLYAAATGSAAPGKFLPQEETAARRYHRHTDGGETRPSGGVSSLAEKHRRWLLRQAEETCGECSRRHSLLTPGVNRELAENTMTDRWTVGRIAAMLSTGLSSRHHLIYGGPNNSCCRIAATLWRIAPQSCLGHQ